VAVEKTGSPELWQTPLWKGLAGLLISPSRGLLVFSPILGLAFWGMVEIWRSAEWRSMRPLTLGVLAMMALQCKWFDWWGGWTFGYRPWLDVVPFLALFIVPALEPALRTLPRQALFAVALGWSVFVQALGAFSYDRTWNDRVLHVVRVSGAEKPRALFSEQDALALAEETGGTYVGPSRCNIDKPYCRYRLWSLKDSLLVYQLANFQAARARRLPSGWSDLHVRF
jgi:hypothetical protein